MARGKVATREGMGTYSNFELVRLEFACSSKFVEAYTSLIIYHIVAEINGGPSSSDFYFIK